MSRKPIAVAIVQPHTSYNDRPVRVPIIKSKAYGCVAAFAAPNWRPMGFKSIEAARAKIQNHPGFMGWA